MHLRLLISVCMLSFCAMSGSQSLMAQGDSVSLSFADSVARRLTLDEVTVSARRHEEPVVPVQALQGSRLQALSTQSVADAMRYFSGVQIKDYGGVGGLKTVDVRSMGSNHLGVFYDGIEIGNAQNGTVDLGKFSMENMEQVSLYNGQKSEIFQSAKDFGSAGTLYLRTRRPRFVGGKSYNVSLTMKAGTFGLANPSVLYEQRLTDNLHLSASAEFAYAHGRYHFRYRRLLPSGQVAWDTTAVRQNGDVRQWRAEVGLFGYMPEGKWHVKGYFYDSEKGIPGAIVNNVWKNAQRQWDRNAFVQGNLTKTITQGYDFLLSAKYSNDRMRYLNPDTTLMYIDNDFTQQEVYLSMAHRVILSGARSLVQEWQSSPVEWDVALSADYQYNTLAGNLANFVFPERHTVLVAAASQLYWTYVRAQASLLSTLVVDKLHQPALQQPSVIRQQPQFTPAVFVSYQPLPAEQFFVRAFYKHIFRMPTFNDLYYTDIGNISLKPEYTTQYDVGLQYDKQFAYGVVQQAGAKVDGYFNNVTNKIVAIPKGNGQYRWQMMNYGKVHILGCDANASVTFRLPAEVFLSAALSYTFQSARDLTDPHEITYGGQIAYIPWHSGSLTANLLWRGLTVNYSFIYVGERYHSSANIPVNYEQPWYTHDMSVSYEFALARAGKSHNTPRMQVAVEINNMFNQQYEVILNYPMPGINGKGIVKVMF